MKDFSFKSAAVIIFILLVSFHVSGNSLFCNEQIEHSSLGSEDTVIISNLENASFLNDFSFTMSRLKCEWVNLDELAIPKDYHNKNIILIGNPNSEFSWDIICNHTAKDELEDIINNEGKGSIEMMNPWNLEKKLIICVGKDKVLMKAAAEKAIYSIIEEGTTGE